MYIHVFPISLLPHALLTKVSVGIEAFLGLHMYTIIYLNTCIDMYACVRAFHFKLIDMVLSLTHTQASPSLSHPDKPTWVEVVSRRPKPSLSTPISVASYSKAVSSKSKTLPQPVRYYKLMIRNTPSKHKAKDEEIIKLFSTFGRVYRIDRQGSNTAVVYDNIDSVKKGVFESEQRRLVCGRIILHCTYEKLK